jgi:tRNA A37 threonylcarbamoyltransferase TsaD
VGLVDESGRVLINERRDIDFTVESARKFFNFHNENILSLVGPILEKYSQDIFLISASCQEGPFHAMPVGAICANTVSCILNKKIIGVNHQIAHLFANWLDRDIEEFIFPIVSLNMSGAHSNIYLIDYLGGAEKMVEIIWRDDNDRFGGLGALFDVICHLMNLDIRRGEGGAYLEKLALSGESKYLDVLGGLILLKENDTFIFKGVESYISQKLKELGYYSMEGDDKMIFQNNFVSSLLSRLFDLLIDAISQLVKEVGAREVHLVGGVAMNVMLRSSLSSFCRERNINFKVPLKAEYCCDNGAMVAISGYFQWKYLKMAHSDQFLNIMPSAWYYKYYAKNFEE